MRSTTVVEKIGEDEGLGVPHNVIYLYLVQSVAFYISESSKPKSGVLLVQSNTI